MSLIARFSPATRRAVTSSPIYLRTATVAPFSTTPTQKSHAVDVAKEKLKKADRAVSGVAVKGIEKGEHASEKIRHTVGMKSKQAEEKAKEKAAKAKAAGEEFTNDTKGFEG
ncbi:hypothetical protein FQN54_004873 [Arachnomyces sp. PD_36]|nr:hypothetical protein FQN54_004873 [Arachnomyces sp. PD_36]